MGPEVLVFMISMNCPLDFDSELWSGFDAAMLQEWNITAATSCQEVDRFPSNLYAYKSLANTILMETNTTAVASHGGGFTAYIDGLLGRSMLGTPEQQVVFLTEHSELVFQKPLASGVAYPTENMAFVENNFEYSTATVSHELLHLVLEEQGHEKSCYVDEVHENQLKYALIEMGGNKRPILDRFDC